MEIPWNVCISYFINALCVCSRVCAFACIDPQFIVHQLLVDDAPSKTFHSPHPHLIMIVPFALAATIRQLCGCLLLFMAFFVDRA